jgi:6-phosphofructokinase 1
VPFKSDDEHVIVITTSVRLPGLNTQPNLKSPGRGRRFSSIRPKTTAAVVTCGGLCPGLNDIIKGIVTQCHYRYGVTKVFGFRYGFEGLIHARMATCPC